MENPRSNFELQLKSPGFSEASLDALIAEYPWASITELDGDLFIAALEAPSPIEFKNLELDMGFLATNPNIPLENVTSRLDNYVPNNDGQAILLDKARDLVAFQERGRAAGLFIYGDSGVGKTHVAVGVAKELVRTGQKPIYINTDNSRLPSARSLLESDADVFILDDVNSPWGGAASLFRELTVGVHERGGRLLITSNSVYTEFLETTLRVDQANAQRIMDRSQNIYLPLWVEGESQRTRKAWYFDEEHADPSN